MLWGIQGIYFIYLPGHTQDTELVSCSTNGAVDMKLALKASGMGSVMLALKASTKHTARSP